MTTRRLVIALIVVATLGAALLSYVFVLRDEAPAASGTDAVTSDSTADDRRPPADRRALATARRLIAQTDSAFRAVEPLSASEKSRLRRYLQPQHLERARRLGLDPVRDRRTAADLESRDESGPAWLHTNAFYIIDPSMSYAVPLVVPSTKHLLEGLGRRFQTALLGRGLPPYRFILTNVLRTGQDQAALRGTNVNAAQGQSTHEYGTTFDVYYEWFHYAAVHDTLARRAFQPQPDRRRDSADSANAPSPAPQLNQALLKERLYAAYLGFGKTYATRLKAVLGRALLAMQDEGMLLATYERRQPVFHLTVAREIDAPARPFSPPFPPKEDTTTAAR